MADKNKIEIILSAIDRGLSSGINNALKSISSIDSRSKILSGTFKALGAAAAGFSVAAAVKEFVSLSDTYTRLDGRIALVTSSSAEAADVHKRLYEIANESRSTFESTAEVYTRFAQAVKGSGISQSELLNITETLNKAFIISGASTEEAKSSLVQLSQGFSSGALRGDEFNSVMEQGGRVIDLLTSYLKVDRGELRSMAEEGRLTSDVLRNAVAAGAASVNAEFERMPETVGQAANHLKNAFGNVVNDANKGSGATRGIAEAIEDTAKAVEQNKTAIVNLFTAIIDGATWAGLRVLNLANSIRGLSAVAAGALSIKDFTGMSAKEFAEWDRNFGTASGNILIKIRQVSSELNNLGEGSPESVKKAAELRSLQEELKSVEKASAKASDGSKKLSDAQGDVAQRTKLTAKELKDLRKDILPVAEAQEKYEKQLQDISLAEKAGQFSPDKAANEKLASDARTRAAQELAKAKRAAEDYGKSASGANKAWSDFGVTMRTVEKSISEANSALELSSAEKVLAYQKSILGTAEADAVVNSDKVRLLDEQINRYTELKSKIPNGNKNDEKQAEIDTKINGLLIERAKLIIETNDEKIRALSQEKILALEQQKIDASKLPTESSRADAELAVEKQIMEERVELKRRQNDEIKKSNDSSHADIIRSEQELAELLVDNELKLNDLLRDAANKRMDDVEKSWRRGIASAGLYQQAVREALSAGAITQEQANEKLIASGDDMGAALSLGFRNAREKLQTDAELMIYIGENVGDQLASGLSSAWDSYIQGTASAKEALIDFARSTVSWLSQIILKHMLLNAIGFGSTTAADGTVTAGTGLLGMIELASGGSVPGWSPSRTADNIPTWLTAREFVQPVASVDYYGEGFMELLRRRLIPRNVAHALAGGTLPRIPAGNRLAQGGMAAGPAQTTVKTGDTKLRVINVLDKNMVGDYLRTADGETAIINMIRRNGSAIRTLIGG